MGLEGYDAICEEVFGKIEAVPFKKIQSAEMYGLLGYYPFEKHQILKGRMVYRRKDHLRVQVYLVPENKDTLEVQIAEAEKFLRAGLWDDSGSQFTSYLRVSERIPPEGFHRTSEHHGQSTEEGDIAVGEDGSPVVIEIPKSVEVDFKYKDHHPTSVAQAFLAFGLFFGLHGLVFQVRTDDPRDGMSIARALQEPY